MIRAAASRPVADRSASRSRLRPPQKATPVSLAPDLSVDAALRQLFGAALADFRANLDGVLRSADPEYVHQLRVAVRRMRCAAHLFPSGRTYGCPKHLNASLRQLSALLGAVRDPEVFIERIDAMRDSCAVKEASRVRTMLAARAKAARKVLCLYLRSAEHERFAARLALWVAARPHGDSEDAALVDVAQRRLASWHGRIRRSVKHVEGFSDAELHRLRVGIKRSRYAAEFFRGLFKEKAVRSYVAALGNAQDRLGSLTDIKTGQALLRELGLDNEASCFLQAALVEGAAVSGSELVSLLKACCEAGGYWKRKK